MMTNERSSFEQSAIWWDDEARRRLAARDIDGFSAARARSRLRRRVHAALDEADRRWSGALDAASQGA